MMEELLAWLQQTEGPLAYVVLGLASLVEYVFPPFPGDTITLFGVFLAVSAGYGIGWVYLALNVGALAGGMMAYWVGRAIGAKRWERTPRFLRTQQARRAIDSVLARFERHGAAYLAINRFVPALRAVFFVAAGMAGLPAWKVAVWGTLSAALWNALLLGAGWGLGASYQQLAEWVRTYSYVAIGALVIGALVALARVLVRKGAGASDDEVAPPREDEEG
jgi:membrane protein DedA with SNARE-associated domain